MNIVLTVKLFEDFLILFTNYFLFTAYFQIMDNSIEGSWLNVCTKKIYNM